MPIAVTYPGVYIEELESGQHTVTGAATNIAAFIGRAPFGPTDLTVTIFSFGDFTRQFGGLQFDYPMSYAVQDFFANGGSQAVIARLFEPEPGTGDGVAQLKFPGPPPMLPEEWELGANAKAGATQLAVLPPIGGSEGKPEIGLKLCFAADPATTYLVTNYTEANPAKKIPPSITIAPGLTGGYRKCTPLTFDYGDSPSGWTVLSQAGSNVTLAGGTGLPSLGQNLVFAKDSTNTVYTAVSEPTLLGSDPATMQVTLALAPTPKAGSIAGLAAVTITDPVPLPMPTGWEIDTPTRGTPPSSGTATLINGTNPAQVGDTFTVGTKPDVYVVSGFQPADAKNPLPILSFSSLSGDPLDLDELCPCCAPVFSRAAPQNVSIKTGPKLGGTSLAVARTAATSGTIDIGDTFTIDDDPLEYSVRYVDSANNVYFLPTANKAFGSSSAITFAPTLLLTASNPGAWGNYLTAAVDSQGITATTAKQFTAEYGLEANDLFNLTLTQNNAKGKTIGIERYLNLSVKTTGDAANFPNRIDRVLKDASNMARVGVLSAVPPGHGASAKGIGGNDGQNLGAATYLGDQDSKTGMYLLEHEPIFNLLCIPPDVRIFPDAPGGEDIDLDSTVRGTAASYCAERRAFYVVDPPVDWKNKAKQGQISAIDPESLGITGETKDGVEVARNAAVFFPRIWKKDILMKSQLALFAPCGAVAGVMASTDVSRGVWKAPAGIDAGLAGVAKLEVNLTDDENGELNQLGINCLRNFRVYGPVVWGSRTLRGADQFEDDYKYIPVRRLTLFIEDSLLLSTQWAVFEPNDEALWSSLRLSVNSFLADLSRQGAFYDYKVTCDASTTTQDDIANGKVNILVQIAPVKPAEFVVFQIQQIAGVTPS